MEEHSAPALEVEFPASPGASARARRSVHAVAKGKVADIYAVDLAVSEAVTNVVVHAYRHRDARRDPGRVRLTVTIEPQSLCVVVADEAVGMSQRPHRPGMGLGLPLVASVADRVDVEQGPNGTRVLMRFPLAR